MDQILYLENDDNKYIYDSRRNIILKEDAVDDVLHWQNRQIVHPKSQCLNWLLHNNMKNLILQVTMDCNLVCKYCIYSDLYNNRQKENAYMSESIAQKSIDFFLENSKETKELKIGFYGGEPLLAFPLIKKMVSYILSKTSKEVKFSITTNLTLINSQMAEFFQKNNFSLIVSLDGDKSQNDRYRIDKCGNGTYERVEHKLLFLKKEYPLLYHNIIINSVAMNILDKNKSLNFFRNHMDFWAGDNPLPHKVYYIRAGYNADTLMLKKKNNYRYDYILQRLMIRQAILKFLTIIFYIEFKLFGIGKYSKYFELYQSNEKIITLFERSMSNNFELTEPYDFCNNISIHHHGPCVPGQNRLLVTVNGLFYPCEKVSEICEDCIIGDVNHGFNENKIYNLLNLGRYTENDCKKCWAIHLCTFCVVNCGDRDKINEEDVKKECRARKEAIKKELEFTIKTINCIRKNNE